MTRDCDYKITLTDSRGRVLTVSPDSPCRLIEGGLEGFACAGFDVRLRAYASSAGGYAETRRFAERELAMTFTVEDREDGENEDAETIRRLIVSMMDPGEDLILDAELWGERRQITVIPADGPQFRRPHFHHPLEVTLNFCAPEVFFREPEPTGVQFRDRVPLFACPLNLWAGAGTVSGLLRVRNEAEIQNPGDGPCGVVVTFRAEGGAVVHPSVTAGGKYIRCPLTLADGDEMEIDTRPRHKTITVNGERVFLFDRDSTFFQLPPGMTPVTVGADEGEDYLKARIAFTPIYYGM
ncbi:MAG: phage tail family protein [Clostridiales bacterium]|nr:phage tail family protein [Clostridiales bacterium]